MEPSSRSPDGRALQAELAITTLPTKPRGLEVARNAQWQNSLQLASKPRNVG